MLSRKMGLIITITVLSILFFGLLPPSTSLHIHQLQYSIQDQEAVNANKHQLSLPGFPRKLSFNEKVEEYGEVKVFAPHKKDSLPAGKKYHKKQNMVIGSKGTKQEWLKGDDNLSKYFTMDYPIVRRKRPIHNKHLQVVP